MKKMMILGLIVLLGTLQACTRTEKPKYVFLFIGDGMGLAQVSAAEAYLSAKDSVIGNKYVSFSHFPIIGLCTTFSANSYVTCSSAAATALACGTKTNNNMLNITPSGDTLRPITYKLRDAGYKIGVATTVSIDHATPAGFYAASTRRNDYYGIARQLPLSRFNFFGGGDFLEPQQDGQADIYEYVTEAGYTIVRNPQDVTVGKDKVVLFQAENKEKVLPTAIRRASDDLTLSQITEAAIRALENNKGFFVMIEGGQIDWTCHSNDGAAEVYETLDFAAAVQVAVEFYKKHPKETLIIVTADHETGGMALNIDKEANLLLVDEKIDHQQLDNNTYMDADAKKKGEKEALVQQNKRIGFGWTTDDHSGVAVPIYAIGAGSELFGGKMDNTDIPKRICKAMGVQF